MQVMKFGGSSMGSAARMQTIADIVGERANQHRVGVVVSAVGGITNRLVDAMDAARAGQLPGEILADIHGRHRRIIDELGAQLPAAALARLHDANDSMRAVLERDLEGVRLLRQCPDAVQARLLAAGELLSVQILEALLQARGLDVKRIDPQQHIIARGHLLSAQPDLPAIDARFAAHRDSPTRVLLMCGFVAGLPNGELALLGRNGSDYSGALLAYGLHAELCEIWTDVDGVYSADPRLVSDAQLLAEMSYEEAMELSFFGAKVLHPKTIGPLALRQIPTLIRNTLNPSAPGTRIHRLHNHGDDPVRGITRLDRVALFSVCGPGMQGVPGIAARLFGAVSQRGVSVVLITQSSSEYSLSLCVHEVDHDATRSAIEDEFELELKAGLLRPIDVLREQSVLSIVGDGMRTRRGVAGGFFSALSRADVNVVAIAQGASERSISAVVSGSESQRALQVTHQQFFHTAQPIDVFLLGVGGVGSQLVQQISEQQNDLRKQGVAIRICGLGNSKQLWLARDGLPLADWNARLQSEGRPGSVDEVIAFVQQEKLLNPVFVDCTSDADVAGRYLDLLNAGLHVVTANKKANTMSADYYDALRKIANRQRRRFLYETNVGAALPVIDNLQHLLASGDQLTAFSGILSGSMSYVFGLLEEGLSFSAAVLRAKEKQFTEPDPRDDLSGMDVARKLLILFREAGGRGELADVEIAPVFPASFDASGDVDSFLARLPQVDGYFAERVAQLKVQGKVLRFAAEIRDGKSRVGLIEVDAAHPLYPIKGGENALAFHTRRYDPVPLVIRGYGAGTAVTAGGVFADILRTVSFNPVRSAS